MDIINPYKSKIKRGYSFNPPDNPYKYKIQDLETVRTSLHLRPILEAMASDVCSLKITCKGDPVQVELWSPFLEKQAKKIIKEMIVWAWVYGEAIADMDVQLLLTQGGVYKYIRNMQPLNMSKIERKDDYIKYNKQETSYDYLFTLKLFEEAGNCFPNGILYKKAVDSLEILTKSWTQATSANSIGYLVVMDLPNAMPNPSNLESSEELNEFIQGHGEQIGMAFELPPGKDAKIIAAPSTGDFEKPIVYNTYLILSGLRSQFVASQVIQGGGNYNVTQHKEMYFNYISYLADMVCESLNYLAQKVANWEGQELYGEIVFEHEEASLSTITGEFANAVKAICEINNISQVQKDKLFQLMGLPLSETQATTETTETVVTLQSNYISDRIKAKRDSALLSFKRYVADAINGKAMHYKLSNAESIAVDLNLNEQQTLQFKNVWGSLGDKLNGIIKSSKSINEAIIRYNEAWANLEKEVLVWTAS